MFLFLWPGHEGKLHHCKASDCGGLCHKTEEKDERDGEWGLPDRPWRPEWVCGRAGQEHHDQREA